MEEKTGRTASGRRVRVGLIDGDEVFGQVDAFSPADSHLVLNRSPEDGQERAVDRLPTSSVAYVAYLDPSDTPAIADADARPPLRVRLTLGRTILVHPVSDPTDSLGFHAVAVDGEDRGVEFFCFAHGVERIERDEPIGSMLIRASGLNSEDLEAGLLHQAADSRHRIGEILMNHERIDPEGLDRALLMQSRARARIGEVLIGAGLASREDIESALVEQRKSGRRRIGEILVEMGIIREDVLAMTLARKFHLPFVDLDQCLIDPEAAREVPRWILEKHRVLPIEANGEQITLAMSDPLDTDVIDLVRFQGRRRIREVVATPSQVGRYLEKFISQDRAESERTRMATLLDDVTAIPDSAEDDEFEEDGFEIRESDRAVIRLANQMIVEAIERDASDIHVEPSGKRECVGVRIRIDGECVALPTIPAVYGRALVSRIKIMAKLDIAEQRKPQDGKIRIRLPKRTVELRVATIPTVGGEDVVLRVLPDSGPLALDGMDFADRNRKTIENLISRPHGLLLCVGPTGSGKTTSLHSLLGHINSPERKIWTAEDPVEITQPGLRQVEVRPKIGFGFAETLRAFLRADPDVIMVGEMRDSETAEIAVHASLTGHLVFSTLHTNSAPETVIRLAQMGLDPFSFSDALLGILAQRLARRLCEKCRCLEPAEELEMSELRSLFERNRIAEVPGDLVWRARGCGVCRGSGYRGRVALHELLAMDEPLRIAIQQGASADRIREIAIQGGMTTMFQDGLQKCLIGATDVKQVRAVCGEGLSSRDDDRALNTSS